MNVTTTIIMAVIAILVAVVLVGPVATQVVTTVGDTNGLGNTMFSAAQSLMVLVPLVFVAAIIGLPLILIYNKVKGNE